MHKQNHLNKVARTRLAKGLNGLPGFMDSNLIAINVSKQII